MDKLNVLLLVQFYIFMSFGYFLLSPESSLTCNVATDDIVNSLEFSHYDTNQGYRDQ